MNTGSESKVQSLRANRWLRRVLWLVLSLLLLWALAWATVPPLLKTQLAKAASAELGRTLTIGDIDFRPWTLELTLHDLAIASRDGAGPPQLTIKRIYVDAELESLLELAPVVQALEVDEPALRLRHSGDGAYDIDDILARLAAPSGKPASRPLGFALFNLKVKDGRMDFDDRPAGRVHVLRKLELQLPFVSNLQSRRTIKVRPVLAFELNGSQFQATASATPFEPARDTDARLQVQAMDLAPYLPYVPHNIPVRLRQAVFDADLQLQFAQLPKPQLVVRGQAQLSGVALADAVGQPLLEFDRVSVVLDQVRPFEQVVELGSIALQSPRLHVQRDAAGRINLDALQGATAPATPASGAAPPPPAAAWQASVAQIELRDGTLDWLDQGVVPAARLQVQELTLDAKGLLWPMAQPVAFSGAFILAQAGAAAAQASTATSQASTATSQAGTAASQAGTAASQAGTAASAVATAQAGATQAPARGARLTFDGSATDKQAALQLEIAAAPLELGAPYVAQFLEPQVHGVLDARLALRWQPQGLQLDLSRLKLDRLALTGPPALGELPRIGQLSVASASVDLSQRRWSVGELAISRPDLAVRRGQDKRWMFERWLKQPGAAAVTASPAKTEAARTTTAMTAANTATTATTAATAKAAATATTATTGGAETVATAARRTAAVSAAEPRWQGRLDRFVLHEGAVRFQDLALGNPVQLDTSALNVELRNVVPDGSQAMTVQLSSRVASAQGRAGQLEYRGTVQPEPLQARGSVQMLQFPLQALEPYFGVGLNIEVLRADAGFKGEVDVALTPQGPVLGVRGDTVLEDFRANTIASQGGETALAQELLNWKALGLRGIDLAIAPGKPLRLSIRETTLSDFFARVIVHENGRINLQDLVRSDAPAQPTGNAAATPSVSAASAATATTATTVAGATTTTTAATATAAAATAPDPLAPVIRIGPISLVQGKVLFSDRFIKPNYSADLSELTGRLSAFSSVPMDGRPVMADLELRGRAEGTASLEILGKLNPLAKPLALDIKGKVRDLELPPLSPYSVKYAGHGIQRGKLSVDVAYLVQPDGQLTASNQVVLNQLEFGDKVEGAPNSLPVKLAVALLADRNGVIDINLPISGSLNDPQFRLGPIIFKVIVNLIGKALTAPFTLLASAFGGGGSELSQVAFAAGSAVLPPEARAGLDKVAKALTDRPALKMTVVGTANLEVEREAYKRNKLQELLRAEQRREQVSAGQTPTAANAQADAALEPAQAEALLKQVFLRSDIARPRDLAGKPKELTSAEMEALLLANIAADDESMRALALQRGVAVKDYLAAQQLPVERLFLGAARTDETDPKWTPRAELSLATN